MALSLAAVWIGAVAGIYFAQPFTQYLFPGQSFTAGIALVNVLFLIAIPLITVILFVSRLLFGTYVNIYWNIGLGVFWWLNLTCLAIIGGRSAEDFRASAQLDQPAQILQPDSDTLHLEKAPFNYYDSRMAIDDEVILMNDALLYKGAQLIIEKADGDQFELVQQVRSQGRDLQDARALAGVAVGSAAFNQHTLVLDPYVKVPAGQRCRGQYITWRLQVPEGKSVLISEALSEMITQVENADGAPMFWERSGEVWTM